MEILVQLGNGGDVLRTQEELQADYEMFGVCEVCWKKDKVLVPYMFKGTIKSYFTKICPKCNCLAMLDWGIKDLDKFCNTYGVKVKAVPYRYTETLRGRVLRLLEVDSCS